MKCHHHLWIGILVAIVHLASSQQCPSAGCPNDRGTCFPGPWRYRAGSTPVYNGCTNVEYGDNLWCPFIQTLPVGGDGVATYDQGLNQWGTCTSPNMRDVTLASGQTAQCQFPFRYNGVTYLDCTTIDNNGVAWCPTDTQNPSSTTTKVACVQAVGTCDYIEVPGRFSQGGQMSSANTLVDCQNECTNLGTACFGLDWRAISSQCWTHTEQRIANSQAGSSEVSQYRKNQATCFTSTTSATTSATSPTTSRTTTGSFTFIPGACRDYTSRPNEGYLGGQTRNDQGPCDVICSNDNNCFGYQEQTSGSTTTCYYFSTAISQGDMFMDTNSITYIKSCETTSTQLPSTTRLPGECDDTYTPIANKFSYGGNLVGNSVTLVQCEAACNAEPTCVGFDYGGTTCYWHTASSIMPNFDGNNDVNQYMRVSCRTTTGTPDPFACVTRYTEATNTFSYTGQRQVSATTQSQCQAACTADATCVGYDFSGTECYTHTEATFALRSTGPGVNQYTKVEICPSTTSALTPTGGVCVDRFDEFSGFSYGGQPQAGVSTVSTCTSTCLANANCVGFDFNNNNQCYHHIGSIQTRNADTNTRQYVRVPCQTTTGSPAGCRDDFMEFNNTYTFGGAQQTSLTTFDACRSSCLSESNCYGFDWNGGQCYFHRNTNFATNAQTGSGVNQYRKYNTCPQTTTSDVCVDSFAVQATGRSTGGGMENTRTGLDNCQTDCRNAMNCEGFDYNSQSQQCWFHTDASFVSNNGPASANIQQYGRNRCVGTTTGGGCVDTFSDMANMNAGGATSISGFSCTSQADCLSKCKAECLSRADCVAVDTDTANGVSSASCWVHVRMEDIMNLQTASGVIISVRVPCGVTTGAPGQCPPSTYASPTNMGYSGGVQQPISNDGRTPVNYCRDACNADTACLGFDVRVNPSGNQPYCWLHRTASNFDFGTPTNGDVQHYRRDQCVATPSPGTCVDSFSEQIGTLYFGGIQDPARANATCAANCLNNSTCSGYDYDFGNNVCFLHFNINQDATGSATNINHYRRQPCDGATPTPGCASYVASDGYSSSSGEGFSTAMNVADCENECTRRINLGQDCGGFDWAASNPATKCFLHTAARIAARSSGATGVVQYAYQDTCGTTTAGCASYVASDGYSSSGGEGFGSASTTVTDCETECSRRISIGQDCGGFDWAASNPQQKCFLHTAAAIAARSSGATGVVQYAYQDTCASPGTTPGCTVTYTAVSNTGSTGGVSQPGVTTLAACQDLCTGNTLCVGVDLTSTGTPQCYLHNDNASFVGGRYTGANVAVTQYTKVDTCTSPAGCVESFTLVEDRNARDGIIQNGVSTVEQCQDRCRANSTCFSFDFVGGRCWIHFMNVEEELMTATGVMHYRKNFDCGCIDEFKRYDGFYALGGTPVSDANTRDDCAQACRDNYGGSSLRCVGFDYNFNNANGNKCFLHSDISQFNNTNTDPNIDHYLRLNNCETLQETTTAGGCQDRYDTFPNTNLAGGQDQMRGSVSECQSVCNSRNDANNRCSGFDYASGTCYFHFGSDYSRATTSVGVTQYRRDFQCDAVTPIVTGTPPPGCYMNTTLGVNSIGGVLVGSSVTGETCSTMCLYNPECVKADWKPTASGINPALNPNALGECYHHMVDVASFASSCCTQYAKICSECFDKFEQYPDMRATVQGIRANNPLVISECAVECWSTANCVAFDFIVPTTECYLYLNTQPSITSTLGSFHHRLVRCDDCRDSFIPYGGRNLPGGIMQDMTISTVQLCEDRCVADRNCDGFDYNSRERRCYLFLNRQYDANNLGFNPDSTHYMRQRCDETTTTTTTPAATPRTGDCLYDVLFILDSSGSIADMSPLNWERAKNFLIDLVNRRLNVMIDATRVSMIQFSNFALERFDFDQYGTSESVVRAIDATELTGGTTNTPDAFRYYYNNLRYQPGSDNGNRADVADVIILVTDGNTTDSDRPILDQVVTDVKRDSNTKIIGVGVGSVDEDQMLMIVSSPNDYYPVPQFANLSAIVDQIDIGQCEVQRTPPTPPPAIIAFFAFDYENQQNNNEMKNYQMYIPRKVDPNFNSVVDLSNRRVNLNSDNPVYFMSLSVGVRAEFGNVSTGKVDATVSLFNRGSQVQQVSLIRNHSIHNSVDTLSKSAILDIPNPGPTYFEVQLRNNPSVSDRNKLTSLTLFSVSSIMNDLRFYYGERTASLSSIIGATEIFFDRVNGNLLTPSCPVFGTYLFSYSILVSPFSKLNASLVLSSFNDRREYGIQRSHTNHDQPDTLTRTFLAKCGPTDSVSVILYEGSIRGDRVTSLTMFLYRPTGPEVAWSMSRRDSFMNSIQNGNADDINLPFTSLDFADGVNVPNGNGYTEVQCSVSGLYFVSLDMHAYPDEQMSVRVAATTDTRKEVGVYRSWAWHQSRTDTLSRSGLIFCDATRNERLYVNLAGNTGIGSVRGSDRVGSTFSGLLICEGQFENSYNENVYSNPLN